MPAAGRNRRLCPLNDSLADLLARGPDRRVGLRPLEATGHRAGQALFRRGVRAAGVPGRDRHPAHGAEAWQFLKDRIPHKRRALVDRLLERDEFADYWAMKWSDLLRVKAEFPSISGPTRRRPITAGFAPASSENMPYDQFVREMLTASGSNFRVPQVNFYRAVQSKEPQAIAQAVALTFMGARAEVAKERLAGMAAFFSQIGYKPTGGMERGDRLLRSEKPRHERPPRVAAAVFPDGTPAQLSPGPGPARIFADWLITPKNPWFARNIVNRVWFWLLGRGIIHEPDDIRPDNPPSNPELLAFLEQELVAAHYDLKHLYRLDPEFADLSAFLHRPRATTRGRGQFRVLSVRRLEAEVLIDALCQITGTTEIIPADSRAVHLHPRGPAFDRPARRQHHQLVPGYVRPSVARYGLGSRTQQSSHGRPAPAPAEFQPYPSRRSKKCEAAVVGRIRRPDFRETVNRLYLLVFLALAHGRGAGRRAGILPVGQSEPRRRRARSGLVAGQQSGISVSALGSVFSVQFSVSRKRNAGN